MKVSWSIPTAVYPLHHILLLSEVIAIIGVSRHGFLISLLSSLSLFLSFLQDGELEQGSCFPDRSEPPDRIDYLEYKRILLRLRSASTSMY
ncbi:hypothetical protein CSUI_011542 [Cystoisospora suis]|uniref:Uncharacterized protein n=1 Tax=Cystoisospora suis TaxID=483139 RepID=A0A2C6KCY2_9APIC|nr:hypothetical protein CSUI_011542 [Cystoisospora suis]